MRRHACVDLTQLSSGAKVVPRSYNSSPTAIRVRQRCTAQSRIPRVLPHPAMASPTFNFNFYFSDSAAPQWSNEQEDWKKPTRYSCYICGDPCRGYVCGQCWDKTKAPSKPTPTPTPDEITPSPEEDKSKTSAPPETQHSTSSASTETGTKKPATD